MSTVGPWEIYTQQRVVEFFTDTLTYTYLGHWKDRIDNSNVEEKLLANWLKCQGHSDQVIAKVLFQLDRAVARGGNRTLYDANRAVYDQLRYGVKVQLWARRLSLLQRRRGTRQIPGQDAGHQFPAELSGCWIDTCLRIMTQSPVHSLAISHRAA